MAIKIIKSLARTTVLDRESKGKFITSFVTHLITWVVGSINFTLRNGSRTQSPWTRFTGIKIDMNIHFRVAFLDLVICHKLIQERTNNLESRGFVGLVVARDISARGAFQVINLNTMKICTRYHFKLVDSENLRKYVNDKLQEPIFKANYIAESTSEIATADIDDFEVSVEEVAAMHEEIARLNSIKSTVEGVSSSVSASIIPVANPEVEVAAQIANFEMSNTEDESVPPIANPKERLPYKKIIRPPRVAAEKKTDKTVVAQQ